MRQLISLLGLISLSTPLHAESFFKDSMFGISIINQNIDIKASNGTDSATSSDSATGIGLYLDKYYKRKFRFNGTWSFIPYDEFDVSGITLSADYLVPVNRTFSLFGGAALGGAIQKYTNSSIGDSSIGAVYGVQTGGILYLNKYLMMELGYRLRLTSIETEITDLQDTTVTAEDISETYLSLLIMF